MRPLIHVTSAVLTAVVAVTLVPGLGQAQDKSQQVPLPPGGFKPPPMPAVKAYKAVAVTPPTPYDDPSFTAFRKQLAIFSASFAANPLISLKTAKQSETKRS